MVLSQFQIGSYVHNDKLSFRNCETTDEFINFSSSAIFSSENMFVYLFIRTSIQWVLRNVEQENPSETKPQISSQRTILGETSETGCFATKFGTHLNDSISQGGPLLINKILKNVLF